MGLFLTFLTGSILSLAFSSVLAIFAANFGPGDLEYDPYSSMSDNDTESSDTEELDIRWFVNKPHAS